MATCSNSFASRSADIQQRTSQIAEKVAAEQSWLETRLKPKKITARYPIKGKALLFSTCGFGSLGDALFGYNSGIMSGLLVNPVFVQRFFSDYGGADGSTAAVNPSITGISVACLQASAAVGALIAGRLGDIVGRKRTVRLGGIIYFLSAFIQIFAPGFATFIVGRTLQGFGVGFLSMVVPIIQTEIAAPHTRGLMVGIEYTCLIAGYMLSCWVDYGFHFLLPDHISWQGPFIIQIILSFILIVMSFFLPETPRWLASNGFTQECLQTVADLHSGGDTDAQHVQKVHFEIQEAVIYESELGKAGWMEMFTRYRKRTIVGITVQMFAQLNGINIISFYLPSTLSSAGFSDQRSLLYTAANSIPYTAATVVTWWLADRWGRKPLLISGGVGMAVLLGIVCAFTEASIPIMTRANGQYAFIMLYNIVYGFTWGPMPWLLPAEIFPLRGRSKGMALATTSNWIFNFIIGMVSPDAFAGIHGYFYLVIAGFCLFSAGLTHFYYIETANHSLEEIAIAFGDKAFADGNEEVMDTITAGDEKTNKNKE
ncbi:general substrate transporter [Stemphylium lycopersici]|uniref:General substrate transporter n=1 Tax=Stemphylium lycopersici TaxID=183478 RepID=A0A364N2V2_STELY|nr:mfs sugar transporter [Stemphylium lycopersici]RAR05597.1 general substrate transporter [Stemphylium lycopersici]RAR10281.1 general substrate transporter [Stemphylium lycopersici]